MLKMKVYRSKYYSPLFQNRALAPLQIPASLCEGPIYLLLCWVITLLLKSTSWRAQLSFASITVNLYWVWLWLDLFYHELHCLVSPWSLKVLYIYVLQSQKGLARYHHVILYHDCFEKVLSSEIYYYCSLVDYAIDRSYHELHCLVSPWSLKVLYIYVLQSQKGLARYHHVILYHDCFEKVLSSEIYYYCSLVDYAIDRSWYNF